MSILTQDPATKFLSELKFTLAYRRPRNLKDKLVSSDLTSSKKPQQGSGPCKKPKCLCCPMMRTTTTFTSKTTREPYNINGSFDCSSSYVIYMIECRKCQMQYVGQTSTSISLRMTAHRCDIKKKLNKSVPNHHNLDTPSHSIRDVSVIVLCDTPSKLMSRTTLEAAWIQLLKTLEPYGLNVKDS